MLQVFILFFVGAALFAWLWLRAAAFYQYHRNLRDQKPLVFKLVGFNEQYLDNPKLWIKHFKIYLVLVAISICITLVYFSVILWGR